MSKNISILQDSEEKTLKKVEKIKTQLANGNVCYWVPEDEYPLGVLTVTEDGVYYPSTDPNGPYYGYSEINVSGIGTTTMGQLADIVITKNGTYESSTDSSGPYYGYAKVTVNVSGSGDDGSGGGDGGSSGPTITGKDGDGDDAIVGTDEDGKIVTSKLPTRISINVYPNNLVYEDGQTIDFTGLRVKAFLPDDTEWGIVDDNELIKPVTVAEGNGETTTYEEATSDLVIDGVSQPFKMSSECGYFLKINSYTTIVYKYMYRVNGCKMAVFIDNSTKLLYMICASNTNTGKLLSLIESDGTTSQMASYNVNDVYTYDGKTVYCTSVSTRISEDAYDQYGFLNEWQAGNPINYRLVAWTLIYGNIEDMSSQQTIPLQWKRPGNGKVLETSFTIAVHGSGDSGSSPG